MLTLQNEIQAFLPARHADKSNDSDEDEEANNQGILGAIIARTSEQSIKSQLKVIVTAALNIF